MTDANDCDIERTQDLIELFETPREKRDQEWIEDFLDTVPTASLVSLDPQIQRGPDGFPYFMMSLPKPDEDFDAFSVEHAISYCLKHGCGIALFKNPDELKQPEWIFTFGSLWSYDQYKNFVGDPNDERPDKPQESAAPEEPVEGREVAVSPPSEDFLPAFARQALQRFFKDAIGLQKPNVAMITDPKSKPARSLMFTDLLPERFEKEEHFMQLMTALRWFLPATRGLMVAAPQLSEFSNPL